MSAQKLKSKIITTEKGGIGMTFDVEFIKTLLPSDHLWLIETDSPAPSQEEPSKINDSKSNPQGPVRVK